MKKYDKPAMRVVKLKPAKLMSDSPNPGGDSHAPKYTRDWDDED